MRGRIGVSGLCSDITDHTATAGRRGGGTGGTVPVALTRLSSVVLRAKVGALRMKCGGAGAAQYPIWFDGKSATSTTAVDKGHLNLQDNSVGDQINNLMSITVRSTA